jgi:hypothetical protein
MLRVVLVDDHIRRIYDLGSVPTDDPAPVCLANRIRVSNLLRRDPAIMSIGQKLIVNIDGQPCQWARVTDFLGDFRRW